MRAARRIDRRPPRLAMAVGAVALAAIVVGALVVVGAAARGPSVLSPPSHSHFFPAWLAGPLGGLWPFAATNATLQFVSDAAVVGMYPLYIAAVLCAPRLRRRWTFAAIIAVHAIFLISPPLALTDVFNYLNYGRMEIVHGLNPYATIPVLEPHGDAAYALSNWHHLLSPYGPLFTIITFALVPLGVATSFWVFKAILMLASLATLLLLWRCAEMLHRDPLKAVLLVGLNPPVLIWGLGGAHNDFLMVLLMMLAVYLLLSARRRPFSSALATDGERIGRRRPRRARLRRSLAAGGSAAAGALRAFAVRRPGPGRASWRRPLLAGRAPGAPGPAGPLVLAASVPALPVAPALGLDGGGPPAPAAAAPRWAASSVTRERLLHVGAGVALVTACAIKLPAAILVPIVFVAAPRRLHLLAGLAGALLVIGAISYSAFGAHIPDLGVQSKLVTSVGLPNLLGSALGLGGETVGLRTALTALLIGAVGLCAWWAWGREGDWILPAALAVLVLVLTLSWQAPWYVLWLLPLAALARRPHLRVIALLLGVYLVFAFTTSIVNLRPPTSSLQQVHSVETQRLVH